MSEYLDIGMLLGGRYEILEKVGSGGMAFVYKAKCRLLQRYVAVKVLRPEFKEDSEFIKRFDIEAQAAASLSHPNIVSIYDIGRDGELHYIVMEYVEGITLKEYITEKGALSWREAASIERQICSALECAHKNHIIHHDIKPHNIILTPDNVIKVADFGIARAATTSTLVAGGSAIGSVHYFSPEQARGGYTDEKSDIYSAGIVFYELLTGRVPFDGESPIAVALMHVQKEAATPTAINPDIPDNVEHVVLRAISKEQRARYQSATDMLADINAVMSNKAITTEQDGATIKIDPVRNNRKRAQENKKKAADAKKKGKSKGEKIAMWLAIGIATAITIAAVMLIVPDLASVFVSNNNEYTIPKITDIDVEKARNMIAADNITIEIISEEPSGKTPKGYILEQDPSPGRKVKPPYVIKVKVSAGEEMVEVPRLVNLEERSAVIMLESVGLVPVIIDENSETIPEGVVLGQSPDPGTKIKKGEQVRVRVSNQMDRTVSVPNVMDKTRAQAKLAIEGKDLTVAITEEFSEQAEGMVIAQDPVSGAKLPRRGVVNIVVSKGPAEPIETPPPVKQKQFVVVIPQDRDSCAIRVTADDKVIHDATHDKSEGDIVLSVPGNGTVVVRIYIDGELRDTTLLEI